MKTVTIKNVEWVVEKRSSPDFGILKKGKTYTLPAHVADRFIEQGLAILVKEPAAPVAAEVVSLTKKVKGA